MKYLPIMRQFWLPISMGFAGLMFLGYGLIGFSGNKQTGNDIVFESASASDSAKESVKKIVVDIEGAVEKPGVYELDKDSRVQDVLIKAGGMSDEADRGLVAKSMNLAAPIIDGAKIYIPFEGEESAHFVSTLGSTDSDDGLQGLINVNTASENDLDTLPGVGPVTAGKIIGSRPYEKTEDLVTKKAVGNATFEKIKDKISVY